MHLRRGLGIGVGVAILATCLYDIPTFVWVICQLGRAILPAWVGLGPWFEKAEGLVWGVWGEGLADGTIKPLPIPSLSLKELFSKELQIDLSKPLMVQGVLNSTNTIETWGIERFLTPPIGDLVIDYFTDARRFNTVPDAKGPVGTVAKKILNGGHEKFGTEIIFRSFPHLVDDLPLSLVDKIVGEGYIRKENVGETLTIPVFMAHGNAVNTTRTDLHCEPIANVVLHIHGSKKWTVIVPKHSNLLRPQISPDGRAYIFSKLSPTNKDLERVERYEFIAKQGDLLFLPTWTWHRVDYIPGVTALTASLFHVRPRGLVFNNPLFAFVTLPNMLKEYIGLKMQ
mmetsp:Transcript_26105/g.41319  ORF Transcript_26105/g.41319 Transcript_26105/m.41319 type:complete len:341 (-) Transcript_26105:61-1083(-)